MDSSIVGAIVGGIIAGGIGIISYEWNRWREREKRKKLVARAIYKEITKYNNYFSIFLSNLSKISQNFRDDTIYKSTYITELTNIPIISSGPNASLLSETSPFILFFEDIFQFDNLENVYIIDDYIRSLQTADKYLKNLFGPHVINQDFINLKRNIEYCIQIISDSSVLDYLNEVSGDFVHLP